MSIMTHLTSSVPPSNSILTLGGNETSPVEPRLDVFEGPLGGYFSEFAWRVEPSSTVLRHRLGELPGIWPGDFNQNVLVLPTNSWAMIQQSNPTGLPTQPIPTNNPTFVNGTRIVSPPELEQRISEAIKEVLSSRKETIYSPYLSADPNKYLTPKTPVSRRIEQLILEEDGNEELFLDRQQQAKWLKQIMAAHWALHLPQPFIGFDLEEGFFVASWQSDTECNTLTIDAKEYKGWYEPWPIEEADNPLPDEIDLTTEAAWVRLRTALTTTQS